MASLSPDEIRGTPRNTTTQTGGEQDVKGGKGSGGTGTSVQNGNGGGGTIV